MSDAVALAIIAMFQAWGEAALNNMAMIVPAIGTAIIALMNWYYNRKSTERAEAIKEKVAQVEASAVTSAEQARLMAKGAERIGFEGGIKTERNRASDLQALQDNFKPEATDVFMRRTDGPDQNNQR